MTIILSILLGVLALGVVIFVHELGHLLAAKAVKIGVEVFSVGIGKPLLSFRRGGTIYRLSLLPLGGYCRMRGEASLRKAWEEKLDKIPVEPGDYYAAAPWRRIIVSLAGPFFNFLFALVVLTTFHLSGRVVESDDNRIILSGGHLPGVAAASETPNGNPSSFPAREAGLATGDRIIQIDESSVRNFMDIQVAVDASNGAPMSIEYLRDGQQRFAQVRPILTEEGSLLIGIAAWRDLLVSSVAPDSSAALAGLREGDRITAVEGVPVVNTMDLETAVSGLSATTIALSFERDGAPLQTQLIAHYDETGGLELGLSFHVRRYQYEGLPVGDAFVRALADIGDTFVMTFNGIGRIFRGALARNVISGPARLVYFTGEITMQAMTRPSGILYFLQFLSLISAGLLIMNLLPLPLLDGGMVLLFLVEALIRKPLNPRFLLRFQTVGVILVLGLFLFATLGDIFFFLG